MADEKTGTIVPAEGSKQDSALVDTRNIAAPKAPEAAPSLQPGDPEPVILEETVIKAAPPKPPPPKESPPALPPTPPPASAAVEAPSSPALPAPGVALPAPSAVKKEPMRVDRPVQKIQLATTAPLPRQSSPEAASPHIPTLDQSAQKDEIAKILGATPLPERRGPAAQQSQPAVTVMPKSPEEVTPVKRESFVETVTVPLRTLKNDLQDIVRTKKISLVRAAALEQEKKHGQLEIVRESAASDQRRGRAFKILFTASILVLLGAGAFFAVFMIQGQRTNPPDDGQFASILFSENTVTFPLGEQSPIEVERLLGASRTAVAGSLGSITRIVPTRTDTTERAATFAEFNAAMGSRIPSELLRALSTDFFFGLHTVDENAPILIVPVDAYERAFAGMLAWEATMNADLAPLFTPVPDQVQGSNGLPEKRRFEDLVMRNYDVRALKDDAGVVQLYYSFPTKDILVIAESAYSFKEILSRLKAERRL